MNLVSYSTYQTFFTSETYNLTDNVNLLG